MIIIGICKAKHGRAFCVYISENNRKMTGYSINKVQVIKRKIEVGKKYIYVLEEYKGKIYKNKVENIKEEVIKYIKDHMNGKCLTLRVITIWEEKKVGWGRWVKIKKYIHVSIRDIIARIKDEINKKLEGYINDIKSSIRSDINYYYKGDWSLVERLIIEKSEKYFNFYKESVQYILNKYDNILTESQRSYWARVFASEKYLERLKEEAKSVAKKAVEEKQELLKRAGQVDTERAKLLNQINMLNAKIRSMQNRIVELRNVYVEENIKFGSRDELFAYLSQKYNIDIEEAKKLYSENIKVKAVYDHADWNRGYGSFAYDKYIFNIEVDEYLQENGRKKEVITLNVRKDTREEVKRLNEEIRKLKEEVNKKNEIAKALWHVANRLRDGVHVTVEDILKEMQLELDMAHELYMRYKAGDTAAGDELKDMGYLDEYGETFYPDLQ